MFSVLNPFHMQVVGSSSIVRALSANRFEIVFLGHDEKQIFWLAQYRPEVQIQPMTSEEKVARLESYSRARDYSIMNLPVTVRDRLFSAEWPEIVKQLVVHGISKIDPKGRITPRRGGLPEN